METRPENVTQILETVGSGDEHAAERLLPRCTTNCAGWLPPG